MDLEAIRKRVEEDKEVAKVAMPGALPEDTPSWEFWSDDPERGGALYEHAVNMDPAHTLELTGWLLEACEEVEILRRQVETARASGFWVGPRGASALRGKP